MKVQYVYGGIFCLLFLLSFFLHRVIKIPAIGHFKFNCDVLEKSDIQKETELQIEVNNEFNKINTKFPKLFFIHFNNTTSAQKSRATMINPKDSYCVGDTVTVQVDMFDYLGKRKTHGGDFLVARIFSPDMKAGASGQIKDFKNGIYHINFTLFWQGTIHFSIILIHPSEGVSALWQARNKGYNYVDYTGKFISQNNVSQMKCGFVLNTTEELCEYSDFKEEEYFYCLKPKNMACGSLVEMKSVFVDSHSYLSLLEKSLFSSTNIRNEIPKTFGRISAFSCNYTSKEAKKCTTGIEYQFPGGYSFQNRWTCLSCKIDRFRTMDAINECIKGKIMFLIGDSTMLQWMTYLSTTVKSLKAFNLYGTAWPMTRLYIDMERNIKIQYQKHANPFIMLEFYTFKEEVTIPHLIDQIAGNKDTVIIFTLGMHFRLFPVHHFIRRVINIRRAIERLLKRSPDTKVIIKMENSSEMNERVEMLSDYHGYIHYLIMNSIFKDINVGVVDAWDMTNAFGSKQIHPKHEIIANEIDLLLSYIC
uniref:NXPE C-terminal domain-containing protein n=1 Tax=Leptobrachium leishanense TaxID=445787 RepID=A0A8C5PR85_9ANUR